MKPGSKKSPLEQDTRDIAKGTLVNFLGVLARSLNVIFYIFLSQVYGAGMVGIFVISRSSVDVLSKLGILGFDRGILTTAAKHSVEDDLEALYRSVGQALLIGITATVIIIIFLEVGVVPFVEYFFERLDVVVPLQIMGFGMIFWTISAVLLFATRALRIMKYEVIVKNVAEPLGLIAFAVPFYFLGWGVSGLAIAFLLSAALGSLTSVYFYSRKFSLKKTAESLFVKQGRGKFFRFSAPIGIYDMFNLLLQRIDLFILGHYAASATVGIYSIAQNAAFTFRKVRQSFDPIVIPVISAAQQLKDRTASLKQYQNVTRWVMLLNAALFGLCFFAARSIMRLFGEEFVLGSTALIILTAAVIINSVFGISELFILINQPYINLLNTLGIILIAIALNLWLVPEYGMIGAATSILLAYSMMNLLRISEVWFLYRIHPFTKYHLRVLGALVPSFLLVWGVKVTILEGTNLALELISVLMFLILYTLILWALGMAEEEKVMMSRLFSRMRRG